MKRIEFPEAVEIVGLFEQLCPGAMPPSEGKRQWLSWRSVVAERLCDPLMGRTLEELRIQGKIFRAIEAVPAASRVLQLEDADYRQLLEATKNPSGGYSAAMGPAALPFLLAITNATDVPPAPTG